MHASRVLAAAAVMVASMTSMTPAAAQGRLTLPRRGGADSGAAPVVRARGQARPGEAGPAPVRALAASEKLHLAQISLAASGINVSGVVGQVRLSPANLEVPSQGRLLAHHLDWLGSTGFGFGSRTVEPASVTCYFKPAQSGRPYLVDFAVSINPNAGTAEFDHYYGGLNRPVQLPPGDHHVTAIVIPEDTNWHYVWIRLAKPLAYAMVTVHYCEITALK